MRTRAARRVAVRYIWDRLMVNFWFAPAILALAAVLLAWAMYWLDTQIPNELLQSSHFILAGTSGELRVSLLNIAGTVLATAGVVFTLLTLPLSTVVAQYGSRLLRLFLADRTTQFVLGMFVGTFVYCIAAALSIPPADVELEAPQLTATLGVYLMLATFATLILLVQHISTMLQAPNIAAAAGAELQEVVRAQIQDEATGGADGKGGFETRPDPVPNAQGVPAAGAETESYPIRVKSTGYIQFFDPDVMLTWPTTRTWSSACCVNRDSTSSPARRSPWSGPPTGSMSDSTSKFAAPSRSGTGAHLPRISNTRSTSSPKWLCEPCLRRSTTRSRP
jgi:uncharacterized membrane protein